MRPRSRTPPAGSDARAVVASPAFDVADGALTIVKPPSGDPLPPPAPLPAWSGPSDYTRQLRSVGAPTDPAAPIAAPAAPAGEKHSIVPLLLILNIVVIIATGLLVYFALKRR